MPGVTGREMKGVAFGKIGTNSWNVATSVTYGARFATDGGLEHAPVFVEDRSFGETFLGPAEVGDINPPDLTFTGQMRYLDNCYKLEALAMGSPAAVVLATSAATQVTSWTHVIDLAPSTDGLAATFAMDRKLYVAELTSGKIYGFGETFGDGGIVNQTFKVLGSKTTDISSINTNSVVHSAAYPALGGKIFRNQGIFRINAQSGGSLAGGDTIAIEAFDFSFERPQDRSFATGSDAIIEPADNEFPEVMATITFPRMNTVSANSLERGLRAGTAYKFDVTYTSPIYINSTNQSSKMYQAPYAELQKFVTPTAGAAQVKPQAMFKLKKPAAAPTGMAGVTTPFRITRIMANSVAAFA
jgi:hypothetical protein